MITRLIRGNGHWDGGKIVNDVTGMGYKNYSCYDLPEETVNLMGMRRDMAAMENARDEALGWPFDGDSRMEWLKAEWPFVREAIEAVRD